MQGAARRSSGVSSRRDLRARLVFARMLSRARASSRCVGVAVMWHRIGTSPSPPGRLDPAFGVEAFEAQVRGLARSFECVPASQLRAAALARRRGQPVPVALTFDDDLAGHHALAAPVLRRHGVTGTFFLTGATLRAPFGFWWQRVDRALDRGMTPTDPLLPPLEEKSVAALGEAIRALPPAERDALSDALLDRAGPDPPDAGLDGAQVADLVRQGFEIGFHTRRHDSLTALDDEALATAMLTGRAELEALCGGTLAVVAYPHGDADERVAAAAADAGLRGGFHTRSGAVSAGSHPLLEPRVDATKHAWPGLGIALLRRALSVDPAAPPGPRR